MTSTTFIPRHIMSPISARDASYWFTVASVPSSSRVHIVPRLCTSTSLSHGYTSTFLSSLYTLSTNYLNNDKSHGHSRISQQEQADLMITSLYDSNLFVPIKFGGDYARQEEEEEKESTTRKSRDNYHHRPIIIAEEVYEYQRYQMVLGWGSKGHLLPLDPEKYMRVVHHSMRRGQRYGRSSIQQEQDLDNVVLEWLPSTTFPDILLPKLPSIERQGGRNTSRQRSRSAANGSRTLSTAQHHVTATSVMRKPRVTPRWEWVSPWHLEVPVNNSSDAVDGWQYGSSFSQFTPRPLHRSRGRSIDSITYSDKEMPSSSPSSVSGKRLRVRRRKWVRFRRLRSSRSSMSSNAFSSAFDDAFLDSMSGWLRKRGHVRKNWKARYFVLEKSVLRYYTDSSCTKLRGEVLLFHPQTRVHYVDVHMAGGKDASFAVQVGPEYTLLLQADQLRDRENWMYCIEDALLCRDSYHPQGLTTGPGPFFDLRESVAHRRMLSAEAMALDGGPFRDNVCGISHTHGGAARYEDVGEGYSADGNESSLHDQRRSDYGSSSSSGSNVLRLWALLHAKPGGVLSVVSSASPTMRSLLRACDQFLVSSAMHQHISGFLTTFRQKYAHLSASTVTTFGAAAWTRLSEPWAPVGVGGDELDSDPETREGLLGDTPHELYNVTTLQDARSLLALKNYRFFLERSLELIMDHLSNVASSSTFGEHGHLAQSNEKRAPTDDEWALTRRAALYKLERCTFIPLQEIIYQLLGARIGPGRGHRQEEEERFEQLRALVGAKPQSFLEIQISHQSPSEWKSAICLLDSMDNYSLPSEKAAVLVETARCIYETHAREHGFDTDTAGSSKQQTQPTLMAADDFLPIFIYVLARCHLRSVIVARHLISETMITALMIGETGYYATMLEAAIGYIAAFNGRSKKTGELASCDSGK